MLIFFSANFLKKICDVMIRDNFYEKTVVWAVVKNTMNFPHGLQQSYDI